MKAVPIVCGGVSEGRRLLKPLNKPAAAGPFAATARAGLATLVIWAALTSGAATPSWEASPARQTSGQFWRYHWYERGLTQGNPLAGPEGFQLHLDFSDAQLAQLASIEFQGWYHGCFLHAGNGSEPGDRASCSRLLIL